MEVRNEGQTRNEFITRRSALLAAPAAVLAHHGSAMYDETKAVMVKGVVTDWSWANPHCLCWRRGIAGTSHERQA